MRSALSRDPAALLRALVRGEVPPRATGLLEAAREHELVSLLAHARPHDTDLADAADHQHAVLHQALRDLPAVASACMGTVWALVRGVVLAETVYLERLQRDVAGIEVLVGREGLEDVVDGLERVGARLVDRNWRAAHRRRLSSLRLRLPSGTLVTVRWSLIDDPGARRQLSLPDLVRRRQHVNLDGLDVFRLDPADALLDLCVHSTLTGGHKLVWVRDIHESMRSVSLPALLTRARPLGVELIVATAMLRAGSIVDLPLLEAGGAWGSLMQLVSRTRPPGRVPSALVSSTRMGFWSSTRALLRRRRAGDPAPLLVSVDEGWRRRYFDDVVAGRL